MSADCCLLLVVVHYGQHDLIWQFAGSVAPATEIEKIPDSPGNLRGVETITAPER